MKIVKYFFVGGVSACVDIGLFTIFAIFLGFNYLLVGMCTFLLATAVNYVLSIYHVFESGVRFTKKKEIIAVFLVSGVGLLINQVILFASVEIFDVSKFFAKIVASGSVFIWNYSLRSFYIFQAKKERSFKSS